MGAPRNRVYIWDSMDGIHAHVVLRSGVVLRYQTNPMGHGLWRWNGKEWRLVFGVSEATFYDHRELRRWFYNMFRRDRRRELRGE